MIFFEQYQSIIFYKKINEIFTTKLDEQQVSLHKVRQELKESSP